MVISQPLVCDQMRDGAQFNTPKQVVERLLLIVCLRQPFWFLVEDFSFQSGLFVFLFDSLRFLMFVFYSLWFFVRFFLWSGGKEVIFQVIKRYVFIYQREAAICHSCWWRPFSLGIFTVNPNGSRFWEIKYLQIEWYAT